MNTSTDTEKNVDKIGAAATARSVQLNGSNVQKLTDMISAHPEMILVVSHEVKIEEECDSSSVNMETALASETNQSAKEE